IGKPVIMDEVTIKMCVTRVGRIGFAMVLVEIDVEKGIKDKIEIMHKSTGTKEMNTNNEKANDGKMEKNENKKSEDIKRYYKDKKELFNAAREIEENKDIQDENYGVENNVLRNEVEGVGKPIIMDEVTTKMCVTRVGRIGFAMVLVEIDAEKGIKDKIEIMHKSDLTKRKAKVSWDVVCKPKDQGGMGLKNLGVRNEDNSPRISRGAGYDNQRLGNVVGARKTVGTTVVQKSGIQYYNCKEFRHVARECQKPKKAMDAAYHREKMLLCKQEEAGIQLNTEQADWKDDTDDESEDQELEAHYMYMA
nr:ATPase, F1/V1/A1 complex, alpha/beta subunit, zinc knuckle CX2CX4HX4C [Tanacetum cinerariifolium]